jgi:hypothetical protein
LGISGPGSDHDGGGSGHNSLDIDMRVVNAIVAADIESMEALLESYFLEAGVSSLPHYACSDHMHTSFWHAYPLVVLEKRFS